MNSAADVWRSVLTILSDELTVTAISTWFDGCEVVGIGPDNLTLRAPSSFKRGIIEGRYKTYIQGALRELFACDFDVVVTDDASGDGGADAKQRLTDDDKDEEFTFERFVVGNSNKFAHAAAIAVAGGQRKDYNPLLIHGSSGLGKTHLLHAIRHTIRQSHPKYNIVSLTGEYFTNELIHALQIGKNMEFREKYRGADVFLIDDVQFIAGKVAIQEEFFNTFNTLYAAGRQIVLTSDRPPMEIATLEDRLKNRFGSGILADIAPPDYETRMAIIRNKAQRLGIRLPDDVTAYIAERLTRNVRQIEGAVKNIIAYHDLMDDTITVTSAAAIIKDMFKNHDSNALNTDLIINETARYYDIPADDLKGKRRTRKIAHARHVSIYIIRQLTNLPLADIGAIYDRHHTTVLSSITLIEDMIKTSEKLSQSIRDITANINAKT
ncbi:MAG: chromosomal replication initiator protein DnaA [Oscillospiraceae bacterium]|jgi:chromosomal replication initiator protein|nr:chromosomal replication initiator protein DnaA [Oscillospiraceae bacterium]